MHLPKILTNISLSLGTLTHLLFVFSTFIAIFQFRIWKFSNMHNKLNSQYIFTYFLSFFFCQNFWWLIFQLKFVAFNLAHTCCVGFWLKKATQQQIPARIMLLTNFNILAKSAKLIISIKVAKKRNVAINKTTFKPWQQTV